MSEKVPNTAHNEAEDLLNNFDANQQAHARQEYWDSMLTVGEFNSVSERSDPDSKSPNGGVILEGGEMTGSTGIAGKDVFTAEARQQLAEVSEYHKHLESLANREAESDEDYYNRLAEEGGEDTFDRALRSDARLRRAEMMAKDIADRRANGGDAEYISDKEAELERLLNEYADSEGADEDIALRIMDMTAGEKSASLAGHETPAPAENHTFSPDDHLEASRQAAANHENISPSAFDTESTARQDLTEQDHVEAAKEAAEAAQNPTEGEAHDDAAVSGQDAENTPSGTEDIPADDTDTEPIDAVSDEVSTPVKKKSLFGKVKRFFKFGARASKVKRIQKDRARVEKYDDKTRAIYDKANELRAADGKSPLRKAPGKLTQWFNSPSSLALRDWTAAKEALAQAEKVNDTPETKPLDAPVIRDGEGNVVEGFGQQAPANSTEQAVGSPYDDNDTVVIPTNRENGDDKAA